MTIVIQVFVTINFSSPKSEPESVAAEKPMQHAPGLNPLQPVCPACKWSKLYTNMESARKGFAAHKQHCKGRWENVSPFASPVRASR